MNMVSAAAPPGARAGYWWVFGAILAGMALFALHPFTPIRPGIALAGALLLGASFLRLQSLAAPAAAVVGALCIYVGAFPSWFFWPAYLLIPILLMVGAAGVRGAMHELQASCAAGRLGREEAWPILAISLAAGIALVSWVWLLQPDLARFREMIPDWPLWALLGAGAAFSIINAILEELIWRGVLQSWLLQLTSRPTALIVQALSFGAAHYVGFPGGVAGAVLATIYGLMLGILAMWSRGLKAAIVAHVAADAVIFTIVVAWAS
jgi:membrane protease YdiL (CAAX protease family)